MTARTVTTPKLLTTQYRCLSAAPSALLYRLARLSNPRSSARKVRSSAVA